MDKLKPCPFCGGTEINVYGESLWSDNGIAMKLPTFIKCCNCKIWVSCQTAENKDDIITIWNRRKSDGLD